MECVIAFGILLFLFVMFVVVMVRSEARSRAWNLVYDNVGKRYQALISRATWVSRPSMRVPYATSYAVLTLPKLRDGEATQVQMQWSDRQFRIEVASQGFQSLPRMRGMEKIEIDSEFGRRFKIRANNQGAAERWLSSGVIWQIEQLANLAKPHEVSITINRGFLTVRRLGFIRRVDHLDEFLRYSLELYDQSMLTQTEGIEFVNPETAQLLEDPRCQVCDEQIIGEIVFCVRCRTPHCEECWQYTGACSTFACGETRYVRPMVAKPLGEREVANKIELDEH